MAFIAYAHHDNDYPYEYELLENPDNPYCEYVFETFSNAKATIEENANENLMMDDEQRYVIINLDNGQLTHITASLVVTTAVYLDY